ncbi:MAG: hypothetical protein K6E98_00770 [Lachnospiraceae bacterium]|nr:hypothetical protein [Lachnospiraceae bacterium]
MVLIIIWNYIFKLIKSFKNKTVNMTWFKCSIGYFTALFLLTLAVWPGFWEWDEYYILAANVNLHIHVWQSLMSNIIYILSMMILPFPTGVIIVQIILVSIITGYVLSFLFKELKCKLPGKIILWIPFFLMPVLYYAQAPIRLGLYSFLELLFITLLYKLCKYSTWTTNETVLAVILASIIATWRTEGIYYIVLAPLLIWIFMKKEDRNHKIEITVWIIILTLTQYGLQQHLYNNSTSDNYELTAYINSVQELVGYASENNPDGAAIASIEQIGKVFNTEVLITNYQAGMSGIASFWQGNSILQHTEEDLNTMKKGYIGLIRHYPITFLKERFKTYWDSDMFICSTLNLAEDERDMVVNFRNSYKFTGYINAPIRNFFVQLIEVSNPRIHKFLYHPFFTQLVLLLSMLVCLIKKKIGYAGIALLVLTRVPLVFITAPEKYFMYYFPTYLIGAVVLATIIAGCLTIKLRSST